MHKITLLLLSLPLCLSLSPIFAYIVAVGFLLFCQIEKSTCAASNVNDKIPTKRQFSHAPITITTKVETASTHKNRLTIIWLRFPWAHLILLLFFFYSISIESYTHIGIVSLDLVSFHLYVTLFYWYGCAWTGIRWLWDVQFRYVCALISNRYTVKQWNCNKDNSQRNCIKSGFDWMRKKYTHTHIHAIEENIRIGEKNIVAPTIG